MELKFIMIEGKMSKRPRGIGFWKYNFKSEKKNRSWMDSDRLKGTTPTANKDSIQFSNFHHPRPLAKPFKGQAAWMDNQYKIKDKFKINRPLQIILINLGTYGLRVRWFVNNKFI